LQNLQVAWKTPTGIYGTVQNCIFANIFATVAFAKLWTLAHTSTGARQKDFAKMRAEIPELF